MSRLDDELKLLLRREGPSADFVERVMSRVNAPAPKRVGWWRRLLDAAPPTTLRWVAAGVAASLLLALFGVQMSGVRPVEEPQQQAVTPPPAQVDNAIQQPQPVAKPPEERRVATTHKRRQPNRMVERGISREEGERAKAQLMRALEIASATLNEAQKIIVQSED